MTRAREKHIKLIRGILRSSTTQHPRSYARTYIIYTYIVARFWSLPYDRQILTSAVTPTLYNGSPDILYHLTYIFPCRFCILLRIFGQIIYLIFNNILPSHPQNTVHHQYNGHFLLRYTLSNFPTHNSTTYNTSFTRINGIRGRGKFSKIKLLFAFLYVRGRDTYLSAVYLYTQDCIMLWK